MGVVRWFHPVLRTTRAETYQRETRAESALWRRDEDVGVAVCGTHGYAENGDPMHLGEGPP